MPTMRGAPVLLAALVTACAAPPKAPGAMDGPTYTVRLRDLEARIEALKHEIHVGYPRRAWASSRAAVRLRNDPASPYALTRAVVLIDGAVQFATRPGEGDVAPGAVVPVFLGAVPSGEHAVEVLIDLRCADGGPVDAPGARYRLHASLPLVTTAGRETAVDLVVRAGGEAASIVDRPAIVAVQVGERAMDAE